MFASSIATWTCIGLLTPFWWGLALITLAFIGDLWPRWHVHVSHLFDRIERPRGEKPKTTATRKASAKQFAA